jgi:hypothetical protein
MSLPSLELKFRKERRNSLTTTNTNTNTHQINNNIFLEKIPEIVTSEKTSIPPPRSVTPTNIKRFKETFLEILISYFKNNIILINNLVELSEKIVMKLDDLHTLIAILLEIDKSNISIEIDEITISGCCGKLCSKLPRYRKIKDIIINNKSSFRISHNQYYTQMMTEFNISLEYLML